MLWLALLLVFWFALLVLVLECMLLVLLFGSCGLTCVVASRRPCGARLRLAGLSCDAQAARLLRVDCTSFLIGAIAAWAMRLFSNVLLLGICLTYEGACMHPLAALSNQVVWQVYHCLLSVTCLLCSS
jgi:hypothetical protein